MEETLRFTDGKGNFGYRIKLTDRIIFDEDTGFLYCEDAVLGNVGVQYYKGYELGFADKNIDVEVHREVSDVFDETSLKSVEGIPVTLRHPKKLLDSFTATEHIKGAVYGTPRQDGDNIVCNLVIYDKELVDLVAPLNEKGERAINDEFRDLSLGYKAKLVPLDKPNTYKQTEIVYNHVAVVSAGRQANATIRDSANEDLEKGAKGFMGVLARFIGKKIVKNPETNEVTVTDENVEIEVPFEDASKVLSEEISHHIYKRESWDDPTKKIVTETVSKTTTTEEDKDPSLLDEKKEKEKTMEVKDKAFYIKALMDAQTLPDGAIKEAQIQELNDEFLKAFPKAVEVKDAKPATIIPVDNQKEIEKQFKDGEQPKVDYVKFEAESRKYYRELTDPFAHASWKDFNDHYATEQRKGRIEIA